MNAWDGSDTPRVNGRKHKARHNRHLNGWEVCINHEPDFESLCGQIDIIVIKEKKADVLRKPYCRETGKWTSAAHPGFGIMVLRDHN